MLSVLIQNKVYGHIYNQGQKSLDRLSLSLLFLFILFL